MKNNNTWKIHNLCDGDIFFLFFAQTRIHPYTTQNSLAMGLQSMLYIGPFLAAERREKKREQDFSYNFLHHIAYNYYLVLKKARKFCANAGVFNRGLLVNVIRPLLFHHKRFVQTDQRALAVLTAPHTTWGRSRIFFFCWQRWTLLWIIECQLWFRFLAKLMNLFNESTFIRMVWSWVS